MDLIERLNRERETLLRFKLVAGETVTNRVYSELVEAARIAADSIREAAAELSRLTAENAALRELLNVYNLGGWTDAVGPMQRALKAETENAALRADAERLQYLLDKRSVTIDTMLHGNGCTAHTADELRAAIDSARAKESGDG